MSARFPAGSPACVQTVIALFSFVDLSIDTVDICHLAVVVGVHIDNWQACMHCCTEGLCEVLAGVIGRQAMGLSKPFTSTSTIIIASGRRYR